MVSTGRLPGRRWRRCAVQLVPSLFYTLWRHCRRGGIGGCVRGRSWAGGSRAAMVMGSARSGAAAGGLARGRGGGVADGGRPGKSIKGNWYRQQGGTAAGCHVRVEAGLPPDSKAHPRPILHYFPPMNRQPQDHADFPGQRALHRPYAAAPEQCARYDPPAC